MEGDNLATRTATAVATTGRAYGLPFVISASSAGTVIEWYDFYLYATLAPFFAPIFFPSDNPTASLLAALDVGDDKWIPDIGPGNDVCRGNGEARNAEWNDEYQGIGQMRNGVCSPTV